MRPLPTLLTFGVLLVIGSGCAAADSDGGTVKIFHQGIAPPTATIAAGRIYLQSY